MKRSMVGLLVLLVGCATVPAGEQKVAEEDVVARSTGAKGGFAVWRDGSDYVLGYMELYGDEGRALCSLKASKRTGECKRWAEADYKAFRQRDLGPSWWVSKGDAPLVAWIADNDYQPKLTIADFETGSVMTLPFVRKVWTGDGKIHVANANSSWVIAQGEDDLVVHALLVPCMGQQHCFEVGPRFPGNIDDDLPGNWADAGTSYDLAAGRVEALPAGQQYRMLIGGLGGMMTPIGAKCSSSTGRNVLTCGSGGETTVAMLEEGLPATTVNYRGLVLEAGGDYWFANTESINRLEAQGELLTMGQPLPFHSGYAQLSGDCPRELHQIVYEKGGRCLARSPINAVYAAADVSEDGFVEVETAPLDPVGTACMKDVIIKELAEHSCTGTVAFRFFGTGVATFP